MRRNQFGLDLFQFLCRDQIDFVQYHDVGDGDLIQRQREVFFVQCQDMIGIHDDQNAVRASANGLISGIRKVLATAIGSETPLVSTMMYSGGSARRSSLSVFLQQVAANCAADAAVRQIDRVAFDTDN